MCSSDLLLVVVAVVDVALGDAVAVAGDVEHRTGLVEGLGGEEHPAHDVVVGDDVDPDQDGVQFEMSGLTGAADAVGQPGVFTVQGSELDGTAVSEDGVSTATATLILDPPGAAQELSFRARDAAGNQCQDTVTFE